MQQSRILTPRLSSWLDIDLDALEHNYHYIKGQVAPAKVIAVVKAYGLGSGARMIARKLESLGVYMMAVSHFTEAIYLRRQGIKTPILVMNGLIPEEMELAIGQDLTFFVFDDDSIRAANEAAQSIGKTANVHVKVDTGLGRLGILPEDAEETRRLLADSEWLQVTGIGTHMAFPDSSEYDGYSRTQYDVFVDACQTLDPEHRTVWHLLSSTGVLRFPYGYLDAVRCQAILWGLAYWQPLPWPLKPVVSFKTRIVQVKNLASGKNIGYRHYTTTRPTKMAVLPIGAVDGLTHEHAGGARLLVGGQWCPILAMCTCEMMIDVTDVPGVAAGDEVVVVGNQGAEFQSAVDFGRQGKASFMALLCKISPRVPRIYWERGKCVGAEVFCNEEEVPW